MCPEKKMPSRAVSLGSVRDARSGSLDGISVTTYPDPPINADSACVMHRPDGNVLGRQPKRQVVK
jgi:hypothetical protein